MNRISNFINCIKIELVSGEILRFSDSDQEVVYQNEVYKHGSFIIPAQIKSSSELGEDNMFISFNIKADLEGAYAEIFTIDLFNFVEKARILKTGWFGEIKYTQTGAIAEICSLGYKTKNLIGKAYSRTCRARFADQFCKMSEENYSFFGKIEKIYHNNCFGDTARVEEDEYFNDGSLIFTSGKNKAKEFRVYSFSDSRITLFSTQPLELNIDDEYKIIVGCDKQISTCINKFNNVLNFRAEPFIPGRHKLRQI